MDARHVRRRRAWVAGVASVAVVTTLGLGSPVWAADETPDGAAPHVSPNNVPAKLKLSQSMRTEKIGGRHTVFVELAGDGAADTAAAASTNAGGKAAAKVRRAEIKGDATSAFAAAKSKDPKATQLFTVTNAVPGFAAQLNAAAIDELASRSDVVKISPIVTKKLENASTAQLTNAVADWKANNLGKDVSVGVIDTGIDYTHADFGGQGTIAAWNDAHANSANADWRSTMTPLAAAKVVGGYDFVGDDYNADPKAGDAYQPVAHPDADPLGCGEHGTHVAGTVAGYGVTAEGKPFTGDYSKLSGDDLYAMKIGPGMAPAADLYSLKVFGCEGSTDVVIPALDWALDPNGDGDFSDHLDIVNLSLGSDYSPVDDPENAVVDKLAKHGVLPVIAMGNAGDLTDAGGSPGNAVRSVAVASSVDSYVLRDGLKVNAPTASTEAVQFSVAYPWATSAPVTGDVVKLSDPTNLDGCKPLNTADAAAVAGKVAWLVWDDNDATRRCGSAGRSANAANAGAIGAIFTSTLDNFGAGITGSAIIPVAQLTKTGTNKLDAAAAAGTLNVTFDGALATSQSTFIDGLTDTVSSFSSRGTHGSVGVVKPDIAAPGDTISSASLGTGDKPLVISGTSMATPNVAGIAALVKLAHPKWTTEQLKADLMNTAGHDVYSGDGKTGPIYGPARVGAGRVDASAAVENDLLVYSKDVKGAVSASFGVVAVPITSKGFTQKRTLVVQNTGKSTKRLSLSYDAITAQPGVTYTVSPSAMTVRAGESATATVTLSVDPTKLRKTLDPTMDATSGIGVPRNYVSDSSGRVLVAQQGKTALRVPVYGAVKPTSATTTKTVTSNGTSSLKISGKGFALGEIGVDADAFTSLASVLELGDTSRKLKACKGSQSEGCLAVGSDASGDLRYVGAGSADGLLYFGINTFGQWAAAGNSMIPYVDIDTTGDGEPDYEVFMQTYPDTDVQLATTIDLHADPDDNIVDMEPVNLNWGDVDTNVFDSDTLLLPVDPALIGMAKDATSFPIMYQVGTYSAYAGNLDASNAVSYDVAAPALKVASSLYLDRAGTSVPYTLGASATRDTAALVLHLHGAPGDRAEVLPVAPTKHAPGKGKGVTWHPNSVHGKLATAAH